MENDQQEPHSLVFSRFETRKRRCSISVRNVTCAGASMTTRERQKQFSATSLTHAKGRIKALRILSELQTPHGGKKEGRTPSLHKHTMSNTKKLSKETGQPAQLKRACHSRSFSLILLHTLTTFLSVDVTALRKNSQKFKKFKIVQQCSKKFKKKYKNVQKMFKNGLKKTNSLV